MDILWQSTPASRQKPDFPTIIDRSNDSHGDSNKKTAYKNVQRDLGILEQLWKNGEIIRIVDKSFTPKCPDNRVKETR